MFYLKVDVKLKDEDGPDPDQEAASKKQTETQTGGDWEVISIIYMQCALSNKFKIKTEVRILILFMTLENFMTILNTLIYISNLFFWRNHTNLNNEFRLQTKDEEQLHITAGELKGKTKIIKNFIENFY